MVPTEVGPDVVKPRRPKPLVVGILAVVVVFLLVAAALVLPRLFATVPAEENEVVDILTEPAVAWSYDWVGDNDPRYLSESPQVTSIGDGRALVWADFDYAGYLSSEAGSSGWYEGYDEHYDQGYAAGRQYADDLRAFQADTYPYTVPRPHLEDYFPEGAYDNTVEYLGFHDGFGDGSSGAAVGAGRLEAPEPPAFTPTIAAVDSATGRVDWTVDLAAVVEGTDYSSSYVAEDIAGTGSVAVVVSTYRVGESTYTVVALDKATGAVRSRLTVEGPVGVATLDGDLVLSISDTVGERSRVARYSPDALDRDPRWSTDVEGTAYLTVGAGFVIVQGSDQGMVLDGSDGSTATWGTDIDYTTGYAFVGDDLIRITSTEALDSYELQGWSTDGESTWAPIEAQHFDLVEGRLYSAQTRDGAYADLQLIDAATGSAQWEKAFSGAFDGILGAEGGFLLLQHGATVIVLDQRTGEEVLRENTGEFFAVYQGAAQYYVPTGGVLKAYRYDEPGEVWGFELGSRTVTVVGGRLAVVDYREGTLSALAAG